MGSWVWLAFVTSSGAFVPLGERLEGRDVQRPLADQPVFVSEGYELTAEQAAWLVHGEWVDDELVRSPEDQARLRREAHTEVRARVERALQASAREIGESVEPREYATQYWQGLRRTDALAMGRDYGDYTLPGQYLTAVPAEHLGALVAQELGVEKLAGLGPGESLLLSTGSAFQLPSADLVVETADRWLEATDLELQAQAISPDQFDHPSVQRRAEFAIQGWSGQYETTMVGAFGAAPGDLIIYMSRFGTSGSMSGTHSAFGHPTPLPELDFSLNGPAFDAVPVSDPARLMSEDPLTLRLGPALSGLAASTQLAVVASIPDEAAFDFRFGLSTKTSPSDLLQTLVEHGQVEFLTTPSALLMRPRWPTLAESMRADRGHVRRVFAQAFDEDGLMPLEMARFLHDEWGRAQASGLASWVASQVSEHDPLYVEGFMRPQPPIYRLLGSLDSTQIRTLNEGGAIPFADFTDAQRRWAAEWMMLRSGRDILMAWLDGETLALRLGTAEHDFYRMRHPDYPHMAGPMLGSGLSMSLFERLSNRDRVLEVMRQARYDRVTDGNLRLEVIASGGRTAQDYIRGRSSVLAADLGWNDLPDAWRTNAIQGLDFVWGRG